jgi:hypothetical protein
MDPSNQRKDSKSIQQQLNEYRNKHKKNLNNDAVLQKFFDKYKDKIELDKEKLASARICNFVRKHYLRPCDNQYNIPEGKYRYRVRISDNNLCENYDDSGFDENMVDIPYELFEPTGDPATDRVIKESIRDEYLQQLRAAEMTRKLNESKTPFKTVMIDLSIYGQQPELPIVIDDNVYYLSIMQKKNVLRLWNKVNPMNELGKKFQVMLEFSAAMTNAYVESSNKEKQSVISQTHPTY